MISIALPLIALLVIQMPSRDASVSAALAELNKGHVLESIRQFKDVLRSAGCSTASYAKTVGGHTSALARSVGPKRGGIALGVLAIAIGTPFLIRYLRARNADLRQDADARAAKPRMRTHAAHAHLH